MLLLLLFWNCFMIAADLWCLELDVIVTILAAWYSEWLGVLAEGCGRFYYYYY